MRVISSPRKMNKILLEEKMAGKSIGLVPTLGYLHKGHIALIKRARKINDIVAVSIFLNPKQFSAKAFRKYPKAPKQDLNICKAEGVDYVFMPNAGSMYPESFDSSVEVPQLIGKLNGNSIRWHYRAVLTVVAKLFNIIQPNRAYFGKKDPHQLALIKRMVLDLNFPIKIISVPTKRAKDGLALSSRNSLLTPEEREAALVIPKVIKAAEIKVKGGSTDRKAITKTMTKMIDGVSSVKLDFVAVVDADSLDADRFGDDTLIYVSVFVGGKKLTDNRVVNSSRQSRNK
ncbi:MAG TPA: pantoate--beta-alanine ligase [Nitrospinota bacterium]|nr:pantoate--beta-alanine ligase [Nitrospinota bacterium]